MPLLCTPLILGAAVRSAPSPTATHPDWTGGSYPGTEWTLTVRADDGLYLSGSLASPGSPAPAGS